MLRVLHEVVPHRAELVGHYRHIGSVICACRSGCARPRIELMEMEQRAGLQVGPESFERRSRRRVQVHIQVRANETLAESLRRGSQNSGQRLRDEALGVRLKSMLKVR